VDKVVDKIIHKLVDKTVDKVIHSSVDNPVNNFIHNPGDIFGLWINLWITQRPASQSPIVF